MCLGVLVGVRIYTYVHVIVFADVYYMYFEAKVPIA